MTPTETTRWTDTNVLKFRPAPDETRNDVIFWHPELHRFGIRFRRDDAESAWGKGVYMAQFFKGGRDRRISLGKVGASLDEVTQQARTIQANAANPDRDPTIERRKAKDAHSKVFKTYIQDFLTHMRLQDLSATYIADTKRFLEKYFPTLLEMPVKLIERENVADELSRIAGSNGPIAMTRARASLSAYFSWLISTGKAKYNPVDNTIRYESEGEERTLTPDELRVVWNAATPDWEFGRIVRLIILTAARKTQIGGLRKSELKKDEAQIVLPKKITLRQRRKLAAGVVATPRRKGGSKNGQQFIIPLSRQALALLDMHPERSGEFVFGEGEGPWSGWSNGMEALHARIGDKITDHWTLHDVRRTFATLVTKHCFVIPGVKVAPHVADAAINHKPKVKEGVAGIYNQNDFLEDRIPAMQLWADYIEELVKPKLSIVTTATA